MDKILSEILSNSGNVQFSPVLIVPVVIVVIAAVAVFFFGFKKPVEPRFRKLTNVDVNQKKTKRKDTIINSSNATPTVSSSKLKSIQNGSATKTIRNSTSPPIVIEESIKTSSPIPVTKSKKLVSQSTNNKNTSNKKPTIHSSSSNKKVTAAAIAKKEKPQKKEKPVDFDDGEWQTVTSRTDKKKKIEEISVLNLVNNSISSTANNKKFLNEKSSTNAKNQKQLKDQVNKSKKAAIDANKKKKSVVEEVTVVPVVLSNSIETEKPRKIKDVLVELATEKPKPIEEVIAELQAAKWEQSNKNESNLKNQLAEIGNNKLVTKVTVVKPSELVQAVDSINNALEKDEDSWTEAKTPKKSKRRVRKD